MKMMLVNYRHNENDIFKSITAISKPEAIKVAEKLYSQYPCRAHNRFGETFSSYYDERLAVEKELFDRFVSLGGKPDIKNPLYFTLGLCDTLRKNFDGGKMFQLDLDEISQEDISFTLGDSMSLYYDKKPLKLFTKNDIPNIFNSFTEDIDYIEAQLWTYKYFR